MSKSAQNIKALPAVGSYSSRIHFFLRHFNSKGSYINYVSFWTSTSPTLHPNPYAPAWISIYRGKGMVVLSINYGLGWFWLVKKKISVNQQPILRLIDNCTNGTMPFPLDGFQYLSRTPVYKYHPLPLFIEFLPYRPLWQLTCRLFQY